MVLEPITREEHYLAKASGQNVQTPTPITRQEMFLDAIAKRETGGGSGSGGASIDVTAQVGQTIMVKEVDSNGKPTKWEAVDYQPRTHWSEEGKVQVLVAPVGISSFNPTYEAFAFGLSFNEYVESMPLTAIASVEYDGVEYTNLASFAYQGMQFFGNLYFLNSTFGTSFGDTGEPFIIGGNTSGMMAMTTDTEPTRHTIQIYINGTHSHRIDKSYMPQIPTIDLTGYYETFGETGSFSTAGDFGEIYEVIRKNEIVKIVYKDPDGFVLCGAGFVVRIMGYNDLYIRINSRTGRTLRIQINKGALYLYYGN